MKKSKCLVIIPARGGSKGLSGKNIKLMDGKPLITYSIDIARGIVDDANICVSTDADDIISTVEDYGLKVPFKRPDQLATDTATTNDVLLHVLDFYESQGNSYDVIILLQPTSPLRTLEQVKEALALYDDSVDMVVSVKESHSVAVLCTTNESGYLESVFNKQAERRQNIKSFFEYNGAIYIINIKALRKKGLSGLEKKIKYVMPPENSIDIDTQFDWDIAECVLKTNNRI